MFPTIYDQFKKLKKSDVKINKKMIFWTIHAEYGGSYRYRKKNVTRVGNVFLFCNVDRPDNL